MSAGRVGRPHGLDGSFYVTMARPRLLELGTAVSIGELASEIVRRRGSDRRPIVSVRGVEDREGAERLRGLELAVAAADAPPLEDGEWWASELEGCVVYDGERRVGVVEKLIELPSCEALQVASEQAPAGSELLVPMVREAIRSVDVAARRIDVDMSFVQE
ncbi:MAG TPA: ribosome maturation factor RimM [Solirubrobacteraceae bacterium]|nr:ribosome maturation factor RimM [Solirubrobacteraceae bacterium]